MRRLLTFFAIGFLIAVALSHQAQAASCSDRNFLVSARLSTEYETNAVLAARHDSFKVAKREAGKAWLNTRFGDVPCSSRLKRYRALKLEAELNLYTAFSAVLAGEEDMGWFLFGKYVQLSAQASRMLS